MNNYLLQLLKEIKTIIIPGLGAITLTNESTGEMMFMPYLKYDDGNLAKHIAEKEGMDLNDAKNLIAKFVREVNAELDKGNSYDMYQFGRFKKADGDVVFEQWNAATADSAPKAEEQPVSEPMKAEEPVIIPVPEPVKAAEPEAPVAEVIPVIEPAPVPEPVKVETPKQEEKPMTFDAPKTEEKTAPEVIIETAATTAAIVSALESEKKPEIPVAKTESAAPKPVDAPKKAVISPKDRLAAAEKAKQEAKAKKEAAKKKKTDPNAAPKKKRRVFGYILWGLVVLFLGGATYVAVNFNSLKKDFPLLADLAGDNNDKAVGENEIHTVLDEDSVAVGDSTGEMDDPANDIPELDPNDVAPNPLPDDAPVEEPVAEITSKPVKQPKPAAEKPKPVTKPRPKPSSGGNSGSIGSPDPSRPYHVIGGSFGSEANANRFARELIAKGQPSVVVGEFNGMYRVSVASFATQSEAVQAHAGLKAVVPQSWVFRWP